MNKGIGPLIVAIIAIIAGAFAATLVVRKKLAKNNEENDFDTFENPVDDDEFEHFFGDDDEDEIDEAADTAADDTDSDSQDQL